jgi:hypothetical protein
MSIVRTIQISFLNPALAAALLASTASIPVWAQSQSINGTIRGLVSDSVNGVTTVNGVTGRCEEIEKLVWGNFGSKKSRARMPSKRSLGRRHTFCISLDFGQIDFFTSSRRGDRRDEPHASPRQLHTSNHAFPSTLFLKASSLCLASKRVLGGRPPFWGASRRFIDPSRACTNSALTSGRPAWVHRRISASLLSISPAARYCRQALAVQ